MTEFVSRKYGTNSFEIIIKTDSEEHYKATEAFARRLIDHAKPVTAADKIRAMSDRELASFFADKIMEAALNMFDSEREKLTAVQIEHEKSWAMGVALQELKKPADETTLFCDTMLSDELRIKKLVREVDNKVLYGYELPVLTVDQINRLIQESQEEGQR